MISISTFSIEDDITTLYVVGLRITLTSVLLFLLFHLNLILSQKQLRPHGAPDSVKKFGASACHFVGDGCVLNRHYGDLGNISVDNEGKIANVKDIYVSLNEKKDNFIGGKEFVIRENRDDFTTERDDGDAGKIIAKGEIVAVN